MADRSRQGLEQRIDAIRAEHPDPEKFVDTLIAEFRSLQASEVRQIGKVADEILRVSREIGYERGEAIGLMVSGFVHFLWQRNQEALPLILEALPLVDELDEPVPRSQCRIVLAGLHNTMGNYQKTLELTHEALTILEGSELGEWFGWPNYMMGDAYRATHDLDRARQHYEAAYDVFRKVETPAGEARALIGLGLVCRDQGDHDASNEFFSEARRLAEARQDPFTTARALSELASVRALTGKLDEAEALLKQSLDLRLREGGGLFAATCLIDLGNLLVSANRLDEAIERLSEALATATEHKHEPRMFAAHEGLARAYYERGDLEKALEHYKEFQRIKEEVTGADTATRLESLQISLEAAAAQKESELIRSHNDELRSKNTELARLLQELRETQEMLIQSEKMASLGQLTAGIAHEIRNPLNFVNNFSAMTKDLADELTNEIVEHRDESVREIEPALLELASEITANAERILEHGRRAGNIVNSMLIHSRQSGGRKTEVDVNELVSTCVDLAYHGFTAAAAAGDVDPGTNGESVGDFDVEIELGLGDDAGTFTVIEDEIARVLTNILGNAFYAVRERAETSEDGFQPRVSVRTVRRGGSVEVSISDNGPGIEDERKLKVFEPFYTTKPTGSGTGLGLSQSYEIIVERHGGALRVADTDGGGATFVVEIQCERHPADPGRV